jgi:hypothetical protein
LKHPSALRVKRGGLPVEGLNRPINHAKEISNMVDKKSKKRTQVKDLPKKEKKLSKGDMKKVKGGVLGEQGMSGKHEISIETIEIVKKPVTTK